MNNLQVVACVFALSLAAGAAQTPSAQSATTGSGDQVHTKAQFAPGVQLRFELDKSIDAKKAKVGDPVQLKMMDELMGPGDKVVAPRGAKVMGHIVEVSAHQKDTASTLGIAFDKMVMPDNTEVPLNGTIQAIGEPPTNNFGQSQQNAPVGVGNGSGSMGSGPGGRMGSGMGNPTNSGMGNPQANPGQGNTPSDTAPATANGQLTPNSQGVIGMSGVTLSTGSSGESLLTNPKHNIKLDSGTQMVVRTK